MIKFIKIIIILIILSFDASISNANIENIEYEKNIKKNEIFNINLNLVRDKLEEKYKSKILFEWNMEGENTQNGSVFEKQFEKTGDYEINLSIYKVEGKNKELIINQKINIFVYRDRIIQIFDENLGEKKDKFVTNSKDSGIFIEKIIIKKEDIEKIEIIEKISKEKYNSKYITIWGGKEFIFDILSKMNSEYPENKFNFVLISSFNIDILQKYIGNFTTNKTWIKDAILIDESAKYQILNEPKNINLLREEMENNNYKYINISTKGSINKILFISKFINNLSNIGFSTINIYLIIIIPFLLIGVVIFKHLIGLGTTGILTPTITTLLFLKIGFVPTIIILIIFLTSNILISGLISKYNLHYTPKITLVTIINIIVIIFLVNVFISYELVNISINDIMFMIFLIMISEKLINLILSKDFAEYKISLLNTLIFSILAYLIFGITTIKTFILSYPEVILVLIPVSFIIGRFTGLRMAEYFRFREVIKSIEE